MAREQGAGGCLLTFVRYVLVLPMKAVCARMHAWCSSTTHACVPVSGCAADVVPHFVILAHERAASSIACVRSLAAVVQLHQLLRLHSVLLVAVPP